MYVTFFINSRTSAAMQCAVSPLSDYATNRCPYAEIINNAFGCKCNAKALPFETGNLSSIAKAEKRGRQTSRCSVHV